MRLRRFSERWALAGLFFGAVVVSVSVWARVEPVESPRFTFLYLGGPMIIGAALGALLGLTRLRTWGVVAGLLLAAVGISLVTPAGSTDQADATETFFTALLAFLPIFVLGGFWAQRGERAWLAAWLAVALTISGSFRAIPVERVDQVWASGWKHLAWGPLSLALLAGAVGVLLLFLGLHARRRRSMWLAGGLAEGPAGPRRWGRLRVAALLVWVLVTGACWLFVPYLVSRGDSIGAPESEPDSVAARPATPLDGPLGDASEVLLAPGSRGGPRGDLAGSERRASSPPSTPLPEPAAPPSSSPFGGVGCQMALLMVALLTAVAAWLWNRPLARKWPHSRYFPASAPPTSAVEGAWRGLECLLAHHGHQRKPWESPIAFGERLQQAAGESPEGLRGLELEPILACARVHDHVVYGLFLGPGESETAVARAQEAYLALWQRLPTWRRSRCLAHTIWNLS